MTGTKIAMEVSQFRKLTSHSKAGDMQIKQSYDFEMFKLL